MAPFATNVHAHGAAGQNHDIISDHGAATDLPSDPVEITAMQKMLSATSGSLLTGLLATPLDVVRVRWQSQGVTQPAIDFTKLAIPTTATPGGPAFRPSDLGVTACCREVFFTNNNAEACLAGPRPLSQSSIHASNPTTSSSTITCAVEETQQRTFTSTFDGLRKIARNEGVTTLWRGLSPTLVMAIPANIIYFTGYEWLRFNRAGSPIARGVPDDYAPLVAGSTARVLAATAVSPIELFRTRLQALPERAAANPLASTFRGIQDMVAAHGYRALWRGLSLTLWRDVPFSGMYWWGYETIRGRLADARERRARDGLGLDLDLERGRRDMAGATAGSSARSRSRASDNHADTFTDSFIAGAASGGFASVVTMPFDVGKTRTQVFRDTSTTNTTTAAAAAPEERNMARLLWHIFRTEGLPGLFRGCVPRTLRVAPACAIMISSYEVGKRVFRGVNERALAERRGLGTGVGMGMETEKETGAGVGEQD
ncbi:mitochondrial carrier domain-containing protein [Chaetomium sp. MPI-CAGE-AT-0009]|nr:mitochondrial carrier domain-containing protein [Chaetomium sp. MPI-CAGE-AT-0009]